MALPPNIPKRGLSLAEAAEYCGVSHNTLQKYGPQPSKIGERNIYDLKVLDRWLDSLATLSGGSTPILGDPEAELSKAIHERKFAVRHAPRRQARE